MDTKQLQQPLDPALTSTRKGAGNKTLTYLEGYVAIEQANRLFGFDGWGFELLGPVQSQTVQSKNKKGEVIIETMYMAQVRVTVAGVPPRTDIGTAAVKGVNPKAEAHETAIKSAVTDGMKRALRSFGDQFGNGLYGPSVPPAAASQNGHHANGSAPPTNGNGTAPPPPAASASVDGPKPPPRQALNLAQQDAINEVGRNVFTEPIWFGEKAEASARWASDGRTGTTSTLTPEEGLAILRTVEGSIPPDHVARIFALFDAQPVAVAA